MSKCARVAWLSLGMIAAIGSAQTTNVTNSNNGTTNTVPVYTGSATLGNSPIAVSGSNVGIGTTSPLYTLDVAGSQRFLSSGNTRPIIDSTTSAGATENVYNNSASASDSWAVGRSATYDGAFVFEHWSGPVFGRADGSGSVPFEITGGNNVGIGTTSPGATLEVNGNVKLTSGSGASITFPDNTVQSTAWTGALGGGDYAESVDTSGGRTGYGPGDLLVIDKHDPSKFAKSNEPYSTMVAGIYSTKPGTVGRRQTTPKSADEVPMAVVGIVPAKVCTENGAIEAGDLLVSSSTPGVAMKGTDRNRDARRSRRQSDGDARLGHRDHRGSGNAPVAMQKELERDSQCDSDLFCCRKQ